MAFQSRLRGSTYLSIFGNRTKFSKQMSFQEKKLDTHFFTLDDDHDLSINYFCSFCHLQLKGYIQWQAHMITYVHKLPSPSPILRKLSYEESAIFCKFCHQDVLIVSVSEHRCFLAEINLLELLKSQFNQSFCPLVCVLCKSLPTFPSQAILQIHLITRHSPTRDPWRCGFCNSKFKTTKMIVHETHAIEVHGPELNYIYWKLLGEQLKMKVKLENLKYVCGLSHYSSATKTKTSICGNDIYDLFELTLHTLCYHGIVSPKRIVGNRPVSSEDLVCRYCGEFFISSQHFIDHISAKHIQEIMMRKDFILRKGLIMKKVFMDLTCFVCVSLFKSKEQLQIHLMVIHGTEEFGHCGICDEDFINSKDSNNQCKINRIYWKAIIYHEKLHLKQCEEYKEKGIFNPSLKTTPQLYLSNQDFEDQLEARKNVKPGPMFSNEQITFLTLLGQKNYEAQVNMEINDP